MQDWMIGLLIFVLLELIGGGMLSSHIATRKKRHNNSDLDETERKFFQRQYWRRMKASGLVMLLGVLIPLGIYLFTWKPSPWILVLFWVSVMLMTCWICLLAVGDVVVTAARARKVLSQLKQGQHKLEQELKEAKAQQKEQRHQSNGHTQYD